MFDFRERREGVDYILVDTNPPPTESMRPIGIRILKGKYTGITYHYGVIDTASLEDIPDSADGKITLSFDYTIIYPGQYKKKFLENNDDFIREIGDILTSIIIKSTKDANELRNDDPEIAD